MPIDMIYTFCLIGAMIVSFGIGFICGDLWKITKDVADRIEKGK